MSRYFAGKPGQPRARRAADAIAIVIGLLLVAWMALIVERGVFQRGRVACRSAGAAARLVRRHLENRILLRAVDGDRPVHRCDHAAPVDLVRDMGLAVIVAVVAAVLLALWLSDTFPTLLPELTRSEDPTAAFPIVRVAATWTWAARVAT